MKKKEYPKKIYLQIEDDNETVIPPDKLDYHATWCEDRINKTDLVYYQKKPSKK